MLSEGFAQRLRARMSRLGIQANELAEKIGVTPGAVGNWMSGENEAKGRNLRKLATELKCNPMWLSHGEGESATDTPALREGAAPTDLEIWKRRAMAAEKKLEQLRAGLRFLQVVGSDSMPAGPSSITREEAEAIVDEIEELADRDLLGGHPPKSSEPLPPPGTSPETKTPNAP